MTNDELIKLIESMPRARGKRELLMHLRGKKITRKGAMLAKCYDCCGYYADGLVDCKVPLCSLYAYMPFRAK